MISGSATSFPVPSANDSALRTLNPLSIPSHECYSPLLTSTDYLTFIACLRTLPVEELIKMSDQYVRTETSGRNFPFGPTLESPSSTSWLTERPTQLLDLKSQQGWGKGRRIISGNVADEGTILIPWWISTRSDSSTFLTNYYPSLLPSLLPLLPQLLEFYPANGSGSPFGSNSNQELTNELNFGNEFKALAALVGDMVFQAPRRRFLKVGSDRKEEEGRGGEQWGYLFNSVPEGNDEKYGGQYLPPSSLPPSLRTRTGAR